MNKHIRVDVDVPIAVITIAREKVLNALSDEVMRELVEAAANLEGTRALRAVIITGAGDKAFVAGADISEMQSIGYDGAETLSSRGVMLARLIDRSRLVWIAAVNGFALGGGCELAMCCDFIYASTSARFGQPEVKLGVIPGLGGTQRLARRVGIGKAKELIFTGDIIDAAEALRIRLVDAVFPPGELLGKARAAAQRIALNAPNAVAEAKRVLQKGLDEELYQGLLLETEAFAGLFQTPDQKEGMSAFLAKRQPRFQEMAPRQYDVAGIEED
jgi:enoyl-CoA hydratase